MRVSVLAVFLLSVWAASASAAQVQLRSAPCQEAHCAGTELGFEVTDVDGVADDLTLRFENGALVVRGTPAPSPRSGCTVPGPGEVRCAVPAGVRLQYRQVELGDGDDRLTVTGVGPLVVKAGSGDDVLQADPASEVSWFGGPGADRSSGPLVRVSYSDHTDPVSVTYDGEPNDGAAGEGDEVGSVGTGASGGDGSDYGPPFTLDLGAPLQSSPAGGAGAVTGIEAVQVGAGGAVGRLLGGPAGGR